MPRQKTRSEPIQFRLPMEVDDELRRLADELKMTRQQWVETKVEEALRKHIERRRARQ